MHNDQNLWTGKSGNHYDFLGDHIFKKGIYIPPVLFAILVYFLVKTHVKN